MYLPRQPKKPRHNPFKVQYSVRFLYGTAFLAVCASIASFIYASQQVQQRDRRAQRELRQQRPGQRVVIIGGGAGGAALAASLCNSSPDLHVTVIEKDRKQTFLAQYPLAHVGHRSYDLNTSGGIDFLRSPASWNVTRDANLVAGEVTKVLPDKQEVLVAPLQGTTATFSSKKKSDSASEATRKMNEDQFGWLRKVLPFGKNEDTATNADAHPSSEPAAAGAYREVEGGLQAYPYDVLVLACGAKRTLGPLEGLLPNGLADLDRYGIAVNPGITRDTLAHLFQGNVVQVKVPPKSFYTLMQAERAARPPATILYDGSGSSLATGSTLDGAFFRVMEKFSGLAARRESGAALHDGAVAPAGTTVVSGAASTEAAFAPLHPYMFAASRQHDGTFVSTTNAIWKYLDYFNKFSYCQLLSVSADADPLGPAPNEVNGVVRSFWSARQEQSRHTFHLGASHGGDSSGKGDGSGSLPAAAPGSYGGFVVEAPGSKEKTIVVRLPEEPEPSSSSRPSSDTDPSAVKRGEVTTSLVGRGPDSSEKEHRPAHFHFLNQTYITAVDPQKQLVTLYNYAHNAVVSLPYRLLLLDLPLQAPAFLRDSGLASGDAYAEENAPDRLGDGRLPFFPRPDHTRTAKCRVPRAVRRVFDDEASFVDVDPETLQHRRFRNIFAMGDVAGLPTVKSYAGTFAQVPVVAHNVKQVLYNLRAEKRIAASEAAYQEKLAAHEAATGVSHGSGLLTKLSFWKSSSPTTGAVEQAGTEEGLTEAPVAPRKPSTAWYHPRSANARYNGYSSYAVIMTTWRAMWPEMIVAPTHERASVEGQEKDAERGEEKTHHAETAAPNQTRRLVHCDNHLWDNLAWRGARGMGNGVFHQMSGYESSYFFLFNRGVWYPPAWFSVPTFSAVDGAMEPAARGWFGFL